MIATETKNRFYDWLKDNTGNFYQTGSSLVSSDYNDVDFMVRVSDIPDEFSREWNELKEKHIDDLESDYEPDFYTLKIDSDHWGVPLNFLFFDDDLYERNRVATKVMQNLAATLLPELKTDRRARVLLFQAVRAMLKSDERTDHNR